jgi:hypothetical protein
LAALESAQACLRFKDAASCRTPKRFMSGFYVAPGSKNPVITEQDRSAIPDKLLDLLNRVHFVAARIKSG